MDGGWYSTSFYFSSDEIITFQIVFPRLSKTQDFSV